MSTSTNFMESRISLNFEDPSIYHDRVLIVEEKKFHVVSEVLSLWSEHFRSLFNGNFNESDKKEIDLKELDADVFEIFLKMIHYTNLIVMKVDDIIPLIELSYRFLTPMVLEQCNSFIEINLNNIEGIKLQLLNVACVYGIESLKKKLVNSLMDENELSKFSLEEILKIADESNLEDLTNNVFLFMKKNITFDNCSYYLDICENYNPEKVKIKTFDSIKEWKHWEVPVPLIIELTKSAFKHDVLELKRIIRWSIFRLTSRRMTSNNTDQWEIRNKDDELQVTDATFNWFLRDYHEEIFALPSEMSQFIIFSTCEVII